MAACVRRTAPDPRFATQITSAHGCALFPMGDDGEGERSFCYVVVDTRNKRVALWYNAFRSFWG